MIYRDEPDATFNCHSGETQTRPIKGFAPFSGLKDGEESAKLWHARRGIVGRRVMGLEGGEGVTRKRQASQTHRMQQFEKDTQHYLQVEILWLNGMTLDDLCHFTSSPSSDHREVWTMVHWGHDVETQHSRANETWVSPCPL
ncbi:hypothetical protein AAFF_G00264010 [Aldrovandia affinis]|uniref:Uncharacterized protein n=1 Tax=Aldrovandia affinis TaxID=143900 RepID=A0AAD7ST04_9TELE|nr:hypothetical protein AAFF_G00264010 [Aldrovandia affinis]